MLINTWLNRETDIIKFHQFIPLFMLKSLQFTSKKTSHITMVSKPDKRKSLRIEHIHLSRTKVLPKSTKDSFKREQVNGIVILRLMPTWNQFHGTTWRDSPRDLTAATTQLTHQLLQFPLLNSKVNRGTESRLTLRFFHTL
jgi:hypothetical protein